MSLGARRKVSRALEAVDMEHDKAYDEIYDQDEAAAISNSSNSIDAYHGPHGVHVALEQAPYADATHRTRFGPTPVDGKRRCVAVLLVDRARGALSWRLYDCFPARYHVAIQADLQADVTQRSDQYDPLQPQITQQPHQQPLEDEKKLPVTSRRRSARLQSLAQDTRSKAQSRYSGTAFARPQAVLQNIQRPEKAMQTVSTVETVHTLDRCASLRGESQETLQRHPDRRGKDQICAKQNLEHESITATMQQPSQQPTSSPKTSPSPYSGDLSRSHQATPQQDAETSMSQHLPCPQLVLAPQARIAAHDDEDELLSSSQSAYFDAVDIAVDSGVVDKDGDSTQSRSNKRSKNPLRAILGMARSLLLNTSEASGTAERIEMPVQRREHSRKALQVCARTENEDITANDERRNRPTSAIKKPRLDGSSGDDDSGFIEGYIGAARTQKVQ